MLTMPKNHPDTNHIDPYWLSDSPRGIRLARRHTPRGYRCYKDLNLQALLDDDGFIHYGDARRNGFHYLQVSLFKRRLLTDRELDLEFHFWPAEKFKKLRRTKRRGLSYESRVKPMLYRKGLRICNRYDVIPCVELKSTAYGFDLKRCNRIVYGVKALFMGLWKLPHCADKGKNILLSGGQYAILAHGEYRPPWLLHNVHYTEIWGHWHS